MYRPPVRRSVSADAAPGTFCTADSICVVDVNWSTMQGPGQRCRADLVADVVRHGPKVERSGSGHGSCGAHRSDPAARTRRNGQFIDTHARASCSVSNRAISHPRPFATATPN